MMHILCNEFYQLILLWSRDLIFWIKRMSILNHFYWNLSSTCNRLVHNHPQLHTLLNKFPIHYSGMPFLCVFLMGNFVSVMHQLFKKVQSTTTPTKNPILAMWFISLFLLWIHTRSFLVNSVTASFNKCIINFDLTLANSSIFMFLYLLLLTVYALNAQL